MTTDEKAEIARNIIHSNGNRFITIDFIKKDGSLRHMMVNRSKMLEASIKGTNAAATEARRATLKKQNMVCVEELVKPGSTSHQWRTVNLETVKKIAVGNRVYLFD